MVMDDLQKLEHFIMEFNTHTPHVRVREAEGGSRKGGEAAGPDAASYQKDEPADK
jgi:hypothetical protein